MGTRKTEDGVHKVYDAAQQWVGRVLRTDDSLFTPGETIWSSQWLEKLHKRFLDNPDESRDSFLNKLQRQLGGCPPEVYQLMGEVLYFHYLIAVNITAATKQNRIEQVLGWSPKPVDIHQEFIPGLTSGILNPGIGFGTYQPFQVGLIIEFVEQWKEQDPDKRERLLNNPWGFKKFLMGIDLRSRLLLNKQDTPGIQRQALLHLTYPDTFEAIVLLHDKYEIAKTFATLVTDPTDDVDRQLAQIRQSLEPRYDSGDRFDFYMPEVRAQWDPRYKVDLWGEFVRRARAFVESGRLETEEIEYKLEMGRKLSAAREAALVGAEGWSNQVKSGIAGNLIHHRSQQPNFRNWLDESPDDAMLALQALWTEADASVDERLRDFCDLLPSSVSSGPGVRTTLASVLLMGLDVEEYPPFRVGVFNEAYKRTGYAEPERGADEAALYDHALGFLDRFIDEASARGLTLRHRLDAQSVVWGIRSRDSIGTPEESEDSPIEDELQQPRLPDPWSPANIARLAEELLWEPTQQLQEIIADLKEKGQVIFYGPPGTGKTYVAREIAKQCQINGGDFEIVQFHPSYSYEDFVQGFRPRLHNGQPGFDLVDGPLRRIAEQAKANPKATFILVIDELNRGNVAKVFGELYFLLEYRDEAVRLQYGGDGEGFSLPSNLWFICTMNTADRSIALMDAALRRRFYFAPFFPDGPPIKGLLRRWLVREGRDTLAADLVDEANKKLDRDAGIGPSYFMKLGQTLDESRVRRIWDRAVIPYVEEQCFGDTEKLKGFGFDRLKGQLNGVAQTGDGVTEQQADYANPDAM